MATLLALRYPRGFQPVAALRKRRSVFERRAAAGSGRGKWRASRRGRRCRHSAGNGAPAEMFALGRRANENPPKLYAFDAKGFRRDIVEFHPAYHDLMRAKHRRRACMLRPGRVRRARRAAGGSRARGALLHGGAGRDRAFVPDHHDARRARGACRRTGAAGASGAEGHRRAATTRRSGRGGKSRA